MRYLADFHIHSRFSRATARSLNFENLYISAQLKGITVVGTGDFTHPGWFSEIKEKLIPAEEGLFKLREELAKQCDDSIPRACKGPVRFILATEISNIYKKYDKTRKNHNLVFMPELDTAARFNQTLEAIGNVKSDGRPILGLDARNLLEIVLGMSEQSFLIPAHIWTPWFSLFGSKSGFDSVNECFEDLTSYIFAVETGLSSDPGMNWRVSDLDELTLISNSDAHSPVNLGREANLFDTALSYEAIKEALRNGDSKKFLGTIEYFPEEGKYHFDGHRKCQIRFHPEVTREKQGICPVCKKPLTLGVLYRVQTLADRQEGEKPQKSHPYYRLIPLSEILSEIFRVGAKTKRVSQQYTSLLKQLGSEFNILHSLPTSRIESVGIPLLGEAIDRMRKGNVNILAGYDGEYGRITLFEPGERERLMGQKSLFKIERSFTPLEIQEKPSLSQLDQHGEKVTSAKVPVTREHFDALNAVQKRAVQLKKGPVLVVAGPGTGKTRTLTQRIAYLIVNKSVLPENILAVTFTNKAAEEMKNRLKALMKLMDKTASLPIVGTFHSVCLQILKEVEGKNAPEILDDIRRKALITDALKKVKNSGIAITLRLDAAVKGIVSAKQRFLAPGDIVESFDDIHNISEFRFVYSAYQDILSIEGFCDYEDLILKVMTYFQKEPMLLKRYQDRFTFVFVDEYQDLNQGQYRFIRALSPPGKDLFVIGDPDQSIYGFRGSNVEYFKRFIEDYPESEVVQLTQNYRSSKTILEASYQVMKDHRIAPSRSRVYSKIDGTKSIRVLELPSERAEAVAVGRTIENLIGGTGFYSVDFGTIDATETSANRSLSDVAIFFRTGSQTNVFAEVFDKAGIPYQLVSKDRLYHRYGILDLLSLLKVIEDSGAYADLDIIARRLFPTISKKTLESLKTWGYQNNFTLKEALRHAKRIPIPAVSKKKQQDLYECIMWIESVKMAVKELTVEKKIRHITEHSPIRKIVTENPAIENSLDTLLYIAKSYGASTHEFLTASALQTDADTYNSTIEKVSLMTMHAAKGLEFPIVFITGCEDGFIPHHRTGTDPEEERRLFFVAMTRAKEQLYLTAAKCRRIYGKKVTRKLSPFVVDIETQLKLHETHRAKATKNKKDDRVQLKLF